MRYIVISMVLTEFWQFIYVLRLYISKLNCHIFVPDRNFGCAFLSAASISAE